VVSSVFRGLSIGNLSIVLIRSDACTGDMLLYPTMDLPPTSFGTAEDRYSDMLLNRKTGRRAQASIALAYFSRTGDTHDYVGNMSNKILLGSAPFE
jgi:hypothetical protein